MLTPEELHKYRSREFVKQAKRAFQSAGQKLIASPEFQSTAEEQERICTLRQNLFGRVGYRKVGRKCDLCEIDYDPIDRSIKLSKKAGKVHRYMGFSNNDGTGRNLHPEEALFLVDSGDALIYVNGLPVGFNEALSRFSTDLSLSFRHYLVYSHLIRSGYIVRRHSLNNDAIRDNIVAETLSDVCDFVENNVDSADIKKDSLILIKSDGSLEANMPHFHKYEAKFGSRNNNSTLVPVKTSNDRTKWNFDQIQLPNDFGCSLIMLEEPSNEYLPFSMRYGSNRLFLTYDNFSKSPRQSVLMNKDSRSPIDFRRSEQRALFYRPKKWTFLDVETLHSWDDYKRARIRTKSAQEDDCCKIQSIDAFQPMLPHVPNETTKSHFQISYDIYLSDSGFSLALPTLPQFYLIISGVDDRPPSNAELISLYRNIERDIPIRFAVVDGGEILFFNLSVMSEVNAS